MEKKFEKEIEKEIEIKLKAESDADSVLEESQPELVTTEGADSAAPQLFAQPAKSEEANRAAENPLPVGSLPLGSLPVGRSNPGAQKVQDPWFKQVLNKILTYPINRNSMTWAIGLVVILGILSVNVSVVWKWYRHAPRIQRSTMETMVASPLAAWIGAGDAAYAMQFLPFVSSSSEAGNDQIFKDSYGNVLGKEYQQLLDRSRQRKISIANLERFTSQDPGDKPLSIVSLATSLTAEERPIDAVNTLRKVADTSTNPLLKGFLGLLIALAGDLPSALAEFDKGIALAQHMEAAFQQSSISSLYIMKSQILQAMGRPEEGLSVLLSPECEAAQRRSYASDSLALSKASSYLQMGEADKAIVLLCQCKNLNHAMLSYAYLMKGDFSEAVTQARSDDIALSRIYCQEGKLEDALTYAKAADAKVPTLVSREQHTYVLNQLGRYKEALSVSQDLRKFTKFDSIIGGAMQASIQLHADRALAFSKLGDPKNALLEANQALLNNVQCKTALEAAQLASSMLGDKSSAASYQARLARIKPYLVNFRPVINDYNKSQI